MKVLVKICGLTTDDAVAAVAEAGIDVAGFVFADSPRRVTVDQALGLSEGLPEDLPRVAVMRHPAAPELENVLTGFAPDFLQTDREDFADIHLRGTCRPLPVLRAGEKLPDKLPPVVLLEGPVSGSGRVIDWEQASELARRTRVVLAGGLDPGNVADAIRTVRPYGVDVSTGVEREPGRKDPDLIRRFVDAVRAVEERLDSIGDFP